MLEHAEAMSAHPTGEAGDDGQLTRVLTPWPELPSFQVVTHGQAEQRADLWVVPELVATVPFFETDIHDVAGLLCLGDEVRF